MHFSVDELQAIARGVGLVATDIPLAAFATAIADLTLAAILRGLASEANTVQRRAIEASVRTLLSTYPE